MLETLPLAWLAGWLVRYLAVDFRYLLSAVDPQVRRQIVAGVQLNVRLNRLPLWGGRFLRLDEPNGGFGRGFKIGQRGPKDVVSTRNNDQMPPLRRHDVE